MCDMKRKKNNNKRNHLDTKELNIFIRQSIMKKKNKKLYRKTIYNSKTIPSTNQLYLELFCFTRVVPCVDWLFTHDICRCHWYFAQNAFQLSQPHIFIRSHRLYTRAISWSTFFPVYFEIQFLFLFCFYSTQSRE